MKRPAFQFYPADWQKDPALQSCSIAARGLWIELMCIAHQSEPYGHVCINGKSVEPPQLSRLVGEPVKAVSALWAELEDAGVFSIDEQGRIFSRRMVNDERLRNIRAEGGKNGAEFGILGAEHGSKGGRPAKETGDKEPPLLSTEAPPLNPPPSSSSSSSSSNQKHGGAAPPPPGFEQAWQAYPKRSGNNPKADALKAWKARAGEGVLPAAMLAGTERYAKWCAATDKIGTETVMQAGRFFGKARPFEQDFELPKASGGNGSGAPWWASNAGIEAKAVEVGVTAKPGESWNDLKARVSAAMAPA